MAAKKIQSKCIQTFLSSEGEVLSYRTCLPVPKEFYYSKIEEYTELKKSFFVHLKNKIFYQYQSSIFTEVKRELLLIQLDILSFKKEQMENKRKYLVESLNFS